MKILVAGLNHKSAPVSVREKLAFDSAQTVEALKMLKEQFGGQAEFVLLSTCNRVEIYCSCPPDDCPDGEELINRLTDFKAVDFSEIRDYLYTYHNEAAVSHLFTVTSSLDSMVVGEAQIIGQVKDSYRLACAAASTTKVLNRLFHSAFATAKKVHSTTSLSSGRVSVAGVAVELAIQLFQDIPAAKVVLVGAGQMGQLLVKHLLHLKCRNITVINRSCERAESIAESYDIKVGKWAEIERHFISTDIVIASAGGRDSLFTADWLTKIMDKRNNRQLLIIDIAVPRNFEAAVSEIEGVHLYSIDDLSTIAGENLKLRQEDMASGMGIIYESTENFMAWLKAKDIGPLIGQMKDKFYQIGQDELERFFASEEANTYSRQMLEAAMRRVVNKLLHCVIANVETTARKKGTCEAIKMVDGIVKNAGKISSVTGGKKDARL